MSFRHYVCTVCRLQHGNLRATWVYSALDGVEETVWIANSSVLLTYNMEICYLRLSGLAMKCTTCSVKDSGEIP